MSACKGGKHRGVGRGSEDEVNVAESGLDGIIGSTVCPSPETLETKGNTPLEDNSIKRETNVGYVFGWHIPV